MQTPLEAFSRILEVLDLLEIQYMVVGSVASSVHGMARPTQDIDLAADLRAEQVDDFAAALKANFYADPEMIKDALARHRSFNLIHYASAFKFDIFPLQKDEYSQTQFERRGFAETTLAEDTVLNKLRWYRAGGETSERQWNDLRGVLQVSGPRLDLAAEAGSRRPAPRPARRTNVAHALVRAVFTLV